MSIQIRSDKLLVNISKAGAEIESVKNTEGLEFIWQAQKEIWPRHAPVLFPIVGKLRENKFRHNDHTFALGQHGFARDENFELVDRSETGCTFRLVSNEKTRLVFPFDFILEITYKLDGNKLFTGYKIVNPGSGILHFSIGAHPGFNCPLGPEERFEDYFLQFENSPLDQTLLQDGLRSEKKVIVDPPDKRLYLSAQLFDQDALVFENNQINRLSLRSSTSSRAITIECQDWPYFGIWSKKGCTSFVCLEPWYGVADSVSASGNIDEKDGIINLDPGKDFTSGFWLTFQ